MAPTSPPPTLSTPGARPRIALLDVLRGLAFIGILPINAQAIARWGYETPVAPASAEAAPIDYVINLMLTGRLMPLFALLFGIGFALFLASARARTERPRLVLARRLGFLLLIGVLHHLLYPGEVLAFYAVGGLVMLLPASFLPRWLVAAAGLALTIAGAPFGGPALIPGLFLLGSACVQYDVIATLQRRPRLLAGLFAGFTLAAGAAVWLQLAEITLGSFSRVGRVAGVLSLFVLITGVMLLMRSATVSRALEVLFAPIGRMALTNYLSATGLILALGAAIDAPVRPWEPAYGFVVAAVIVALQWVFSTLWLRRFRFGPLEWAWRTATWWRSQPMRRDRATV